MTDDQQYANAGSRVVKVSAGETIIREGDLGDTAYTIIEGEVQVWKWSPVSPMELARLGPGAIFGEMSLVDEKPRSATITALTDSKLKVMPRGEFLDGFKNDPGFAASLLRVLLERLRETGMKLGHAQDCGRQILEATTSTQLDCQKNDIPSVLPTMSNLPPVRISIHGLTDVARHSLPVNPYLIHKLPFRIGRGSEDKLANNDLDLSDFEPYQVSLNHLLVFQEIKDGEHFGEVGLFDRGSHSGSWLNDSPLGGLVTDDKALYLGCGDSELVLGLQDSLFRFRISVQSQFDQGEFN